eukprot:m.73873 g.73873  ORF g.73873 m.73873 type:complete len:56 (+) comp12377_c0_seq2:509-676(+)
MPVVWMKACTNLQQTQSLHTPQPSSLSFGEPHSLRVPEVACVGSLKKQALGYPPT